MMTMGWIWIGIAIAGVVLELLTPTALVSIWFITPTNVDRFIDGIAIVTKPIGEQTWGEVKIQGILWSAVSVDHEVIEAGEQVRVVAIEGAKLLVRSL